LLFERCITAIKQILESLSDALAHLKRRDAQGVLGAIAGLELKITNIRTLMSLAQDFGPKEKDV